MLRSLDYITVGCIVYRPEQGIIAADKEFCDIVDRPLGQVFGATMADLTYPDDLKANEWLLEQALITQAPFVLRKRYVTGSGALQWVENRYHVLQCGEGNPLVSMLTRRVSETPEASAENDDSAARYASYIVDLANGLADFAGRACLPMAADLLKLAGMAAIEEAAIEA